MTVTVSNTSEAKGIMVIGGGVKMVQKEGRGEERNMERDGHQHPRTTQVNNAAAGYVISSYRD